jgi:hypothetical protein
MTKASQTAVYGLTVLALWVVLMLDYIPLPAVLASIIPAVRK